MAMSRSQRLRPPLHGDALYGLPGEVARTLAETTGADEAAILTMFLTCFGNAVGRQPYVRFGDDDQYGSRTSACDLRGSDGGFVS
jgi:hypothetical protein